MEETISTSADSVRTIYQLHSTETGNDQRGHHDFVAGSADSVHGPDTDVDCSTTTSSRYSGVLVSEPSSTHSLVLPSPPDSPGGSPSPSVDSASESSLPSVSSSFFFSSSAPGSPGHSHPGSYPSSHPHSDHEPEREQEHDEHDASHHHQGLIIPSLALPESLRKPTPFGQTLGELRILVLGGQGAGKSFLTGLLLEDNEHVIDVGTWEDWNAGEAGTDNSYAHGKVLRASTDWNERHDALGLEGFEPSKNVEIVELPGYAHDTNGSELIYCLKSIIESPFRALHDVLHPESDPSGVLASLLASPTSPLYTALVFLLPSPPTLLDEEIIQSLSEYIPTIVLPRGPDNDHHSLSTTIDTSKLSAFRPATAVALRTGLFHSPGTVALLRTEAADRFLRWREVERAVDEIRDVSQRGVAPSSADAGQGTVRFDQGKPKRRVVVGTYRRGSQHESSLGGVIQAEGWSKAKWEAEWMENHAQEVAHRMRDAEHSPHRSRKGTMLAPLHTTQFLSSSHRQHLSGSDTEHSSEPSETPEHSKQRGASSQHIHGPGAPFDPLHLPSLLFLSASLLGPLRARVGATMQIAVETLRETRVRVALLGGFCVGVGVGVWAQGW